MDFAPDIVEAMLLFIYSGGVPNLPEVGRLFYGTGTVLYTVNCTINFASISILQDNLTQKVVKLLGVNKFPHFCLQCDEIS